MRKAIIAIDPGSKQSAYVLENIFKKIHKIGIIENEHLAYWLTSFNEDAVLAIEKPIAVPGSGREVSDTAIWCGIFMGKFKGESYAITRSKIRWHIGKVKKTTDAVIIERLIQRFCPELYARYEAEELGWRQVIDKAKEGIFEGYHDDIWQAHACLVTFKDLRDKGEIDEYKFV